MNANGRVGVSGSIKVRITRAHPTVWQRVSDVLRRFWL